jgi:hypothetical protein
MHDPSQVGHRTRHLRSRTNEAHVAEPGVVARRERAIVHLSSGGAVIGAPGFLWVSILRIVPFRRLS